jgi:stage II sporulation protein D
LRLFVLTAIVALVPSGVVAAPVRLPSTVRVDVLSLLSPRRVELTSTASMRISTGATLPAGARLTIDIERRVLRARLKGRLVWQGPSLTVGSQGDVASVDVTGRNRRIRQLPAPVELSVHENRIAIRVEFPLEELVASAVFAEMQGAREPAALAAAAIAIRSYLGASRGRHAREGFDVCDSTHCVHSIGRVSRDQPGASEAIDAVNATTGKALIRDGHIVSGFINACCGGRTATPTELWASEDTGDYTSVECAWCRSSRYFSWTRVLTASSVAGALSDALDEPVRADFSLRTERIASGWVRSVQITGGIRDRRVDGDAFRMAIGRRLGWDSLPSPNFNVARERGSFVFRGAGFGHGIGLCLAGANELARRSKSAAEILEIYFPGVSVVSLPQVSGDV